MSDAMRLTMLEPSTLRNADMIAERPMRLAHFSFLAICLSCSALFGQVPTIINEIDQLESVRDPKCYATANRLEDFIYGTPLDFDARAEKIALQKQFIRDLWLKASAAASERREDADRCRYAASDPASRRSLCANRRRRLGRASR